MARTKKVNYRVLRNERVGIGTFDANLERGQILDDDVPDDVVQALLDGQIIEEVPEGDKA